MSSVFTRVCVCVCIIAHDHFRLQLCKGNSVPSVSLQASLNKAGIMIKLTSPSFPLLLLLYGGTQTERASLPPLSLMVQ